MPAILEYIPYRKRDFMRARDEPIHRYFAQSRLCRGARRPARLGRFRRHPAGRVHPAGAGRRARDHRLDRRPALVRGRGRHDGHLLGRLQRAPGRGARTRRRSRRSSRCARPTTATPTTPTTWAAACSTRTCSGARSCSATAPTRPIPRSSASAGARCGASASTPGAVPGALAAAPVARRLLAPRLGLRGLWRDQVRGLRDRRLGGRLFQRRAAPDRGPHLPEEGADRALGARLPAQRRARARRSASSRRRCAGGTSGSRASRPASWTSPLLRVWLQDSVDPQPFYDERPGRWVAEAAWPSPRIEQRRLFLNPGRLDPVAEPARAACLLLAPDHRARRRRVVRLRRRGRDAARAAPGRRPLADLRHRAVDRAARDPGRPGGRARPRRRRAATRCSRSASTTCRRTAPRRWSPTACSTSPIAAATSAPSRSSPASSCASACSSTTSRMPSRPAIACASRCPRATGRSPGPRPSPWCSPC